MLWKWLSLIASIAACIAMGWQGWSTGDGAYIAAASIWGFSAGVDATRLLNAWADRDAP